MNVVFLLDLGAPCATVSLFQELLLASCRVIFLLPGFSRCKLVAFRNNFAPDSEAPSKLQKLLELKVKDGKKGQS